MNTKFASKIAALSLIGALLAPTALAAEFNPNYLLSDEELEDSFALDMNGIQTVLNRGSLADLITIDHKGVRRSAVEIIWRAAQDHGISAKFLIVLLQKEQSLIEDNSPSGNQLAWATGYAICDDCSKSDPNLQRWKGFGKQVNSAAAQFREGYLADLDARGRTIAGFGPGIRTTIDGVSVTPANNATAALYSYTPHLHGNQNFVKLWTRYFSQNYPSGSLLQARGEDGVWLIRFGTRRPITSKAALYSRFNADNIIIVDTSTLAQYEEGRAISFPNYSLLKDPAGRIYLIVDDDKRWIETWEAFVSTGFSPDEIIDVTYEDLLAYEDGRSIKASTLYPQGRLLQNSETGGVYFVRDGVRHPVTSKTVLNINFPGWRIQPVEPVELGQFMPGNSIKLKEGTLVRSYESPAVYFISDGKRLPILSGSVFEEFGWKWENVISTETRVVEAIPLGKSINIDLEDGSVEIAVN